MPPLVALDPPIADRPQAAPGGCLGVADPLGPLLRVGPDERAIREQIVAAVCDLVLESGVIDPADGMWWSGLAFLDGHIDESRWITDWFVPAPIGRCMHYRDTARDLVSLIRECRASPMPRDLR